MRSSAFLLTAMVQLAAIAAPSVTFAQGPESEPSPATVASSPGKAASPAVRSPSEAPKVWVHVKAREDVVLLQQRTLDGPWETACSAPCDTFLPIASRYRASGDDLTASPDFALDGSHGYAETLVVGRAPRPAFHVGVGLMAAGPAIGVIPLLFLTMQDMGYAPDPTSLHIVIGMAVFGAITFLVGAALEIASPLPQADVSQEDHSEPARPPSSAPLRTPAWSTAMAEPRSLPPVLGVPILSGRF